MGIVRNKNQLRMLCVTDLDFCCEVGGCVVMGTVLCIVLLLLQLRRNECEEGEEASMI